MLEIILNVILLFLVLTGIVTIMHKIALKLLSPRNPENMVLVLPLKQMNDELELILRDADLRARVFGAKLYKKIIILDCGMDDDCLRFCKTACKSVDSLTLCKYEDLECYLRESSLQN